MKHHIIVSPETTNLIIGALERQLESAKNALVDLEAEKEKNVTRIKDLQKCVDDSYENNKELVKENIKLVQELKDVNKKIEDADIDTMVTMIELLEKKLDNFGTEKNNLEKVFAKERTDLHNLIKGIFIDLHLSWSDDVAKLLDERDYFKAASKIAAELKTETNKRGRPTKTARNG